MRKHYLDFLRIVSILSVIVIHATSMFIADFPSAGWDVLCIQNSMSRFSVPAFCMISGALFLNPDKEITIKNIYLKYIPRIIVSLVLWNCFYSLVEFYYGGFDINVFIETFLDGQIHFWFCYMIIGFYICVPILRLITKDIKVTKYLLLIMFVFSYVMPTLSQLNILPLVTLTSTRLQISLFSAMTFYFILGYYLDQNDLNKYIRYLIYLLGIFGAFMTYYLTKQATIASGSLSTAYLNNTTIYVFFETISVFVLAKSIFRNVQNEYLLKFLSISKYVYGIFLMHMFVLNFITNLGLFQPGSNYLITVPFISVLTFVICLIGTLIISKIPVLKDWIM